MARPKQERSIVVAKLIRNRREELGLTIKDTCQLVGVNYDTWQRWEQGTIPSIPMLAAIAKGLGCQLKLSFITINPNSKDT